MAKALAISGTVTRDSFASCKSLARLNWTIDTKLNPTPSPRPGSGLSQQQSRRNRLARRFRTLSSLHDGEGPCRVVCFLGRTGSSPFAERERMGTEGEVADRIPSPPVRHPTDAVQENGTYGGTKAKPLAAYRQRLRC